MKFLAMVSLLLSSVVAMAYPAVGDLASYSGTYSQGPNNVPFTMELTLVQYDAALQQYLQRQTLVFGAQTQVQDTWVKQSSLLNPTSVAQIVSNCSAHGGKLEQVVVGAQALQACALPVVTDTEDSVYWIADVTFGIAQARISNKKDASQTHITMKSHSSR